MQTIKDFFAHPIIQTALVTGASIIVLAWFSKRILAEPLREWELALPAFLFTLWQGLVAGKTAAPCRINARPVSGVRTTATLLVRARTIRFDSSSEPRDPVISNDGWGDGRSG